MRRVSIHSSTSLETSSEAVVPPPTQSQQEPTRVQQKQSGETQKDGRSCPDVMKAFYAFDKAAVAEGAIPVKYKELIAVAVALTTQCLYCIDIHSANARKAGATEAEIAEAALVAASLRTARQ